MLDGRVSIVLAYEFNSCCMLCRLIVRWDLEANGVCAFPWRVRKPWNRDVLMLDLPTNPNKLAWNVVKNPFRYTKPNQIGVQGQIKIFRTAGRHNELYGEPDQLINASRQNFLILYLYEHGNTNVYARFLEFNFLNRCHKYWQNFWIKNQIVFLQILWWLHWNVSVRSGKIMPKHNSRSGRRGCEF